MRKNKKNGFTLAELLIVVAIVAVLVAISIPIFSSQLDKAKIAVDQANVRSAKAAAIADYLGNAFTSAKTYYYNAATGRVQDDVSNIEGYGKYTKNDKEDVIGAKGTPNLNGSARYVKVEIDEYGVATMFWGTGNRITTRSEWTNASDEEKLAADLELVNSLQNVLRSMTYKELEEMFGSNTANKTDQALKIERGWDHTCYTLASSYFDTEGNIDNHNIIYATKLFETAGYSPDETSYLISSWNRNNVNDLMYIKVDIGKDLTKMSESEKNETIATGALVYLNGSGISTSNDPNFGHNRRH